MTISHRQSCTGIPDMYVIVRIPQKSSHLDNDEMLFTTLSTANKQQTQQQEHFASRNYTSSWWFISIPNKKLTQNTTSVSKGRHASTVTLLICSDDKNGGQLTGELQQLILTDHHLLNHTAMAEFGLLWTVECRSDFTACNTAVKPKSHSARN